MDNNSSVRRILAGVLALLLLMPSLVMAQETHLTTTVPSEHAIQVTIEGKGEVEIESTRLTSTGTAYVVRQSTPTVTVKAQSGYTLSTMTYNGGDVSELLVNTKWVMPCVQSDGEMQIEFKRETKKKDIIQRIVKIILSITQKFWWRIFGR